MPDESLEVNGPGVVGIGASAGGLAALRQFFSRTPEDTGLAYVVVVHLSPQHESFLSDILQPHCHMPVMQVSEETLLEPNRIYVIPPGRNLSTIDSHLRLSPMEPERRHRAPIDHFFSTLAETHRSAAIAVVLSGTGSDGATGLRRIKCAGGLTIAQEPQEAEYDGMPQSAIATGFVDFVLPVGQMPQQVVRFFRTEPRLPLADDEANESPSQDIVLQIFGHVRSRTGHDFSRYKLSTAVRRIRRRMQLRHIEELSDYFRLLRERPEENQALVDDMLITVTNFFRDSDVYEKVEKEVIPALFRGKSPTDRVRVWSVGCATGEEAYSLAILLHEHASRMSDPPILQIFASDLHHPSLTQAREGGYPDAIESDIPHQRLSRYFTRVNGGYQIRKEIRDLVIFATHNVLRDPPFSQIDLISCRNVMIYLNRDVQEDVIQLFHYSLNPDGFLLLGSSEAVQRAELFRVVSKKHSLYGRRNLALRESRLPVFPVAPVPSVRGSGSPNPAQEQLMSPGILHHRIVERYSPPSVLLNREHNIIHTSERAGKYLLHPGGEPTNNIFKRIREELRFELRSIIDGASGRRAGGRSRAIPLRIDGSERRVVMYAHPAEEADLDGFLLLVFHEMDPDSPGEEPSPEDGSEPRPELEVELDFAKKRLQAVIDDYETGQEEMRASNEELQSANEELRSTMEELETSKEELQSMNEELQTLNQENKHKVEELSQLSSDLQNLLSATDIATLFLDRDLRILRFTPRLGELFNVRSVDRGRPLSDLTHRLGYETLLQDARGVLTRHAPTEQEVRSENGSWYLARLLPYRGPQDKVEGVVLTFINITGLKQAEQSVRESEERYRLLVESVEEYALFLIDRHHQIATWNLGAQRLFGYSESDCVGRPASMLYCEEDRAEGLPESTMSDASHGGRRTGERWYRRKDGSRFWAAETLTALYHPGGELRGYSSVLRDNTERRASEAALEHRNNELSRINSELEGFAYVAGHDLREPLRMININSQLLVRRFDVNGNPEAGKYAGMIREGVIRMESLIDAMLSYSRVLHADHQEPAICDSEQALEQATHILYEQIAASQATVELKGHFPRVRANESLLTLVFQNLLSNALKYSQEGKPPQIEVSVVRQEEQWVFTITDDGIGFAPEHAERIFGLFNRLQQNRQPGNGLGLAICKKILERYGGRIWASSAGDGRGAAFCFALPVVEAE